METKTHISLTVEVTVHSSLSKVWEYWTQPSHIKNWYFASDDWHAPAAENDLIKGGKFKTHMAAKDGSFSFDLEGVYTQVIPQEKIEFTLADNRLVSVLFKANGDAVDITETFEAEHINPIELQQQGWQAILNSFKKYVELH